MGSHGNGANQPSRSLRLPWSSFILSSACSALSTDSSFSSFICCIFLRMASMVLEAASLPCALEDILTV